ncbi:MAG: DNA-binding protein [Gammaproteobacteria bacterium]|jgi:ParB family chromosome partitioning protein|nr:DNA-binding protein [Gammaproteobacteria bacterium]
MDNSKRNIHNSGPLGILVKTGQIKKVDLSEEPNYGSLQHIGLEGLKSAGSYFKTQSGIQFKENELIFIDPTECEPWEYANRSADEMGEMDELIKSIQESSQLQPALIRLHPRPHNHIKYQIIFGRRRHTACLQLGIPFLVIKKDILTLQEAISYQDAENKFRKDVSNYSNALLYRKLLDNKEFKSEKELAEKLRISSSTLNDLMAYTKLPKEIIHRISNIHALPVYMAIKIVRIIAENKKMLGRLIELAPEIGKSITTPAKLESFLQNKIEKEKNVLHGTKTIQDKNGEKLFTFKIDHKGVASIVFQKKLVGLINFDALCDHLRSKLLDAKAESGRPDWIN